MKTEKTALALLKDYLANVNAGNPKVAASFFAEEGKIEAPYFASLGLPTTTDGQAAIEAAISGLLQKTPSFHFTNIKLILETPTEVVAECESETVLANGETYKQLYINHIIAENGKIVCHREFLDTLAFSKAFLPNTKVALKVNE